MEQRQALYEPSNFTFSTRLTNTKNQKERETKNNYNLILSNAVWHGLYTYCRINLLEKCKSTIFKIQNVSTQKIMRSWKLLTPAVSQFLCKKGSLLLHLRGSSSHITEYFVMRCLLSIKHYFDELILLIDTIFRTQLVIRLIITIAKFLNLIGYQLPCFQPSRTVKYDSTRHAQVIGQYAPSRARLNCFCFTARKKISEFLVS